MAVYCYPQKQVVPPYIKVRFSHNNPYTETEFLLKLEKLHQAVKEAIDIWNTIIFKFL